MGKGSHGHPGMFENGLRVLEICQIGGKTSQLEN